jgi:AraC family transcriptional activator FtrA
VRPPQYGPAGSANERTYDPSAFASEVSSPRRTLQIAAEASTFPVSAGSRPPESGKLARMRKQLAKHRVAMAVQPGAPIFELSVPCEVFGVDRRDIHDPWYRFQVCPTTPAARVAGGFIADQPGTMRDLAMADTVIIIGSENIHTEPPTHLVDAIRAAHRRHRRIVGICSGAFVLAHAGLLDHRRATTHWMHIDDFTARFPTVDLDPTVLYVQDENIFTSAGTAAAIDLSLELVRQDLGGAAANEVARRMVIPPHGDGGQAQYLRWPMPTHPDQDLADALQWAQTHLDRGVTVDDLTRRAHLSRRTLIRRFRDTIGISPQQWLLRQRLLLAQDLLETTTIPVDRVAEQSGMGTAANLRHHFNTHLGVSPHSFRRTFTQPAPSPPKAQIPKTGAAQGASAGLLP